jgi:mRNA-degrading endonuclease RelE of RelBE toxin-antitoxin system
MARVIWSDPVKVVLNSLPEKEGEAIMEKVNELERFPRMYGLWTRSRRFRRHRCFVSGNWRVFYRVVDDVVWIRGIWPARWPVKLSLVKQTDKV